MKKRRLKRFLLVIVILLAIFIVYVEIANRNSKNMNYRQKILKAVYPALMWFHKVTGQRTKAIDNSGHVAPATPFSDLTVTLNNGSVLQMDSLKGKKVLLVNTASECGYTNQYEDLQKLSDKYKDKLVVIGFPANDFKEQEKGTDEEIAAFCKLNFGVSFPLAKKSSVVKGPSQHPVFRWLTDKSQNGWNEQQPTWNFSKYLIDEKGNLLHYFDPGVSPLSDEIVKEL